ncbi:MAG: flagellar hook-length control protein FliK [Gammaproteobacteria bacterium]
MQAISNSAGLKTTATTTAEVKTAQPESGSEATTDVGFLALFQSQVAPAIADLNQLKQQFGSGSFSGKLFPDGMSERPILSQLFLGAGAEQLAADKLAYTLNGTDQLSGNKLFSNLNSEMLSAQNFLEALQSEDDLDTDFTRNLMQELTNSSLRGKGAQAGTTGFTAITNPMGTQQWGDELVSRVKWQIGQTIQEAKISLNPRELGPLQIKINIIDDQAHVQFIANHSSVKEAVEDAIPRLREMLEQSGLMLADTDVSQQSADNGQATAALSGHDQDAFAEDDLEEGEEQQAKVIRQGIGLVDAFI